MRPLIEILEEERTVIQKLDSVHRYTLRTDDPDVFEILYAQKRKLELKIEQVRSELKEYIEELLK